MSEPAFLPQTLVDYAQILGAIGTLAAVVVSLFLANRRPTPSLKVSCSIRSIIWYGQQGQAPRYLTFSVVNEGETPATIVNVGWQLRVSVREKRWAVQDVSSSDHLAQNPPLPHKLQHGESANFFVSLQGQFNWINNIRKSGFFSEHITCREECEKVRVVLYATVGRPAICKPDKEVLDLIWEHQPKNLS